MTMKKLLQFRLLPGLFFISAGLVVCISGSAQIQDTAVLKPSPDKWSLKRCVDYAVSNNISIKQSDIQARLSGLTLKQSKLNQIPTLDAGSGLGINSGRSQNPSTYTLSTQTYFANSLSLQSNVTLFNFFNVRNTIEANRFAWEAALANSEKLKNDISLNVANAYLQVLLSREQANTAELQLRLSQSQLGITRKRVNAGALPELNAAELEAQVAQDSSNLISIKSTVVQNILTLKAYMALDASVPFEVDAPPVDQIPVERIEDLQPEAVYSLALNYQPLQKMDKLQVASAQKTVSATKGAQYPLFSLSASLGSNYISSIQEPILSTARPGIDTVKGIRVASSGGALVQDVVNFDFRKTPYFRQLDQNFSQFVGMNISIPIFKNGTLHTNYQKSKLSLRNTELQLDQDNLTLKQNIYQAYTAALAAHQKFEANQISVITTKKSFDYAQKRYNVGMLNTIDLLTNQNNYFNAKINVLYAQYDYVFKMKVLEFYKGLGIKL
ncbi:TolC family protein [Flavitalea flava]